jgi:uncharacterized surface protein with fasciclin (FAS1) repeats
MTGFSGSAQSGDYEILSQVNNPKLYKTIDLVHMDQNLSTFVNLMVLAGLENSLNNSGQHTLFVPTNDAFKSMTIERFTELTDPENRTELIEFVNRHYIPMSITSNEFKDSQAIFTLNNAEIIVLRNAMDEVVVGGAKIIRPDVKGSNGIIHIIDDFIYLEK